MNAKMLTWRPIYLWNSLILPHASLYGRTREGLQGNVFAIEQVKIKSKNGNFKMNDEQGTRALNSLVPQASWSGDEKIRKLKFHYKNACNALTQIQFDQWLSWISLYFTDNLSDQARLHKVLIIVVCKAKIPINGSLMSKIWHSDTQYAEISVWTHLDDVLGATEEGFLWNYVHVMTLFVTVLLLWCNCVQRWNDLRDDSAAAV